ncbi:MAG: peptidoglycan editing factor PgeF [Candidatus Aminicenantales bacterium]
MAGGKRADYLTLPALERIHSIIHGFAALCQEEDELKKIPALKYARVVFLEQIHSSIVHIIHDLPPQKLSGDALITARTNTVLAVKTADCLPVLMADEKARLVAAVHCGWKGTSRRVLLKAVQALKEKFGVDPASLLVGLGPCIGPWCYEVGREVEESFRETGLPLSHFTPHPERKEKYFLDLKGANLSQLIRAGVERENIHSLDFCSHCLKRYPSWRRNHESSKRMISFIARVSAEMVAF